MSSEFFEIVPAPASTSNNAPTTTLTPSPVVFTWSFCTPGMEGLQVRAPHCYAKFHNNILVDFLPLFLKQLEKVIYLASVGQTFGCIPQRKSSFREIYLN